jgi:FtsZ-binding cell division protein ZapB
MEGDQAVTTKRKMPTKAERLAAQTAKLEALRTKAQELRDQEAVLRRKLAELARPSKKDRDKDRKWETHLRILIGTCVRERIARGLMSEDELRDWMEPVARAAKDREAFGLPPLPVAEPEPQPNPQ